MMDPTELELDFQRYISNLKEFAPDGIVEIDLRLLNDLGLLSCDESFSCSIEDSALAYSFYVIESTEKLTLFNQKFIIWIVPKMIEQSPTTFTLIALNDKKKSRLEIVFSTTGIYNHSSLVLRILEKFLEQIEDNEKEIFKYY